MDADRVACRIRGEEIGHRQLLLNSNSEAGLDALAPTLGLLDRG
jgi:hypothetical protein